MTYGTRRCHDMMTSSNGNIFRVTGLCAGNSPVTGEFPSQRSVTRSLDVFFDLCLNKRLSKNSRWVKKANVISSAHNNKYVLMVIFFIKVWNQLLTKRNLSLTNDFFMLNWWFPGILCSAVPRKHKVASSLLGNGHTLPSLNLILQYYLT